MDLLQRDRATEVIVRLAEERGAKAVVCGTEKRRENLRSRMSKPKRIQHSPPRREFRSCCMMRWIFRLIVMTLAAKLVNRYLGSRHPQPRSRG
jgi:hypothetical protein